MPIKFDTIAFAINVFVISIFSLILCAYFRMGGTAFFDGETYLLANLFMGVCAITATIAYKYEIDFLHIVLFGFYAFVSPRFLQFLLAPGTVVSPVDEISLEEINHALWLLLPTTLMFVVGIAFANINKRERPSDRIREFPQSATFIAFGLFLALTSLELYVLTQPETTAVALPLHGKAHMPMALKIVLAIFSADVPLFAVLYFYLNGRNHSRSHLLSHVAAFASITVFVIAMAMLGSRGAPARTVFYLLTIGLTIVRVAPKIWRPTAALLCFTFAIGAVSTISANHIRDHMTQASQPVDDDETTQGDANSNGAIRMLNRLAYLDYLVVTLSREPDPKCALRYLNFSHYAKNTINLIAPGDPFPESKLSSSNAFGICYRGKTEETMPRYHSEVWTLPGLIRIMAPGWEAFLCLLAGICLGLATRRLQSLQWKFGPLIYAYWMSAAGLAVYFTMGVDHTINTAIIMAARLTVTLAAIEMILRINRFLPPPPTSSAVHRKQPSGDGYTSKQLVPLTRNHRPNWATRSEHE